jgi:hypothetical protein
VIGLGFIIPGILLNGDVEVLTGGSASPVLNQIPFVGGASLGDIVRNIGTGFIILGLFVMLMAVIGILGACWKSKIILTVVCSFLVLHF